MSDHDAICAVCGRSIFKWWDGGIEKPWAHWVEPVPDGHQAIPRETPGTMGEAARKMNEAMG